MIELYKKYDEKMKKMLDLANSYDISELESEVKQKTNYVKYSKYSYNLTPINPSLIIGKSIRNEVVVKQLKDTIKDELYNKYYFSMHGEILKIKAGRINFYVKSKPNESLFISEDAVENSQFGKEIYEIKYIDGKLHEITYVEDDDNLKYEKYEYITDNFVICNYDLYQPSISYTSKDAEVGTWGSPVYRLKFEIELNKKGKPEKTIEYRYMNGEYKLVKVYDESKKKKLVKIDSNIVKDVIKEWIKKIDEEKSIGKEIKALYFGIGEIDYSLRLTGAIEYDKEDEDWACNEDYIPKNEECREIEYPEGIDPEKVLRIIKKALKEIISEFKEIELFKGRHVAVGFDDGELYIIK